MDSLSIARNKNNNIFHVPVLVKITKNGTYKATVPDIPKKKNNGYMEISLVGYGKTKDYAVESLSKNISQWLYERIDDNKPIPSFSSMNDVKINVFSNPNYNDSYEVRELVFYEDEILNVF